MPVSERLFKLGIFLVCLPVVSNIDQRSRNRRANVGQSTTNPPQTWIISGTLSPAASTAGATITVSGTASGTVTADGNGNYRFANLSNGTYTVTPTKNGADTPGLGSDCVGASAGFEHLADFAFAVACHLQKILG